MTTNDLSGRTCLVTGAAGFLGARLTSALVARGARVRVLDRRPIRAQDVEALAGDLADPTVVARACRGMEIVFHTASIMALHDHAPATVRRDAERTNVEGTARLLEAASRAGARRFVFTSSNHVVLDETPIFDGDERLPYADGVSDIYTRTKIAAERSVLAAHDPAGLMTCALRPGGLYGPGDLRFIPRVVATARLLRRTVAWGPRSALVDLTHIDNLVHANLLAAERLVPPSPVGGSAYFISDGEPITLADFNRLLLGALGYDFASLHLPASFMSRLVGTWERVWAKLGWPPPPFGQGEVKTVNVAHSFSIARARHELGYTPVWNATRGIRMTAEALRDAGQTPENALQPRHTEHVLGRADVPPTARPGRKAWTRHSTRLSKPAPARR